MPKRTPEAQRFWQKVDKDGQLPKWAPFLGPCWLWTAATDRHGYGVFNALGSPKRAHRASWWLRQGEWPSGYLDHLCRVRRCVNPDHLEEVTLAENLLRGFGASGVNARKTHCVNGHEFTPENTYKVSTMPRRRVCRRCTLDRQRVAYQRKRDLS